MQHTVAIIPALLAAALAAAAPSPRRFAADVTTPGTWQASCYRGETLAISAQLTDGRGVPFAVPPGADARLLWSTNGESWFSPRPATVTTGGLVRAMWTPDMDCGAAAYRIFLAVSEGGTNISYGANMLLRMLGSPGAVPNELPMPVRLLDFSRVVVTNAPWATYTAGDNIVITNGVISATGGGGGTLTEETDPVFGSWLDTDLQELLDGKLDAESPRASTSVTAFGNDGNPYFALDTGLHVPALTLFANYILRFLDGEPIEYWFPSRGGTFAMDADLEPYATRAWTLSTYGGTNAWMAVKGPLLGIYSCTNSAAGTNTLWESSSAMGGELAGVALRATNNTTRIAALERRPDITSWGDYAPDGTPNPDAEAMVYLNKALTLMGSGFSWATSGAWACLCQSGSVAFQVESQGEIRIGTDATTNYFGLVQGGSVTVGCRTGGIRVEDGVAYLSYAYAGGAFPIVWFCGDLVAGAWQETTPVWTDNGDGTATAAVPATGARGFFKATSTRETGAYFRSNVPAHFPAGVYGTLGADPVKYDSVITIQSGGRTYRIPAEAVQ